MTDDHEYMPAGTHKVTVITREWLVPRPHWQILIAQHAPKVETDCNWLELLLPDVDNLLVVPIQPMDDRLGLMSKEDDISADDPASLLKQVAQKRNIQLPKDWTIDRHLLIWDQSLASREWEYMHEKTGQLLMKKFGALKCYWIGHKDDDNDNKTMQWSLMVKKVQ